MGKNKFSGAEYGYGYDAWGSWIPLMVPESSLLISVLLVLCSCITSTVSADVLLCVLEFTDYPCPRHQTFGYDGSMLSVHLPVFLPELCLSKVIDPPF